MTGEIEEGVADTSLSGLFAALPHWVRTATGAIFVAECALLAAGLLHDTDGNPGFVRIELSSAQPAPGFSSL
jgi:hypothetical protein